MKTSQNRPLISIVTIVYNGEAFIEKTIQSVIKQTYNNIEFIILDGASTDNTSKIVDSYSKYISKYISEPDNGIYFAMNKGLLVASGDWIIMLNAGDEFYSDYVLYNIFYNKIYGFFSMLFGKAIVYYEDIKFLRYSKFKYSDKLKLITLPSHQSVFISKSIKDKYSYDTSLKLIADSIYLEAIIENEKIYEISDIVSKFELGGRSNFYGSFRLLLLHYKDYFRARKQKKYKNFLIQVFVKHFLQTLLGKRNYFKLFAYYNSNKDI